MSTCLLVNKPPRQLIYLSGSSTNLLVNLSTCHARQQISSSTYYLSRSSTNLLVNLLLVTLVNKSPRQLIYLSARQQTSSSTYLLVRSSTNLLVNLSTCHARQQISSSTYLLVRSSTNLLVNLSTRQLVNLKNKKPRHCKNNILATTCRDYWTRTSDPVVPNDVRYQLR